VEGAVMPKQKKTVDVLRECSRCKAIFSPHSSKSYYCPKCRSEKYDEWYAVNRTKKLEQQRTWNRDHKDRKRELSKQYYRAHRAYALDLNRQWQRANVEYCRTKRNRREARKKALVANLTTEQWGRALDYFHNCCAICGRSPAEGLRIVQDHWIALSLGGGFTAMNIVPLCHGKDGCNNKKSSKLWWQWLIEEYGLSEAFSIGDKIKAYFAWVKKIDGV
jgi:hypothetical protein